MNCPNCANSSEPQIKGVYLSLAACVSVQLRHSQSRNWKETANPKPKSIKFCFNSALEQPLKFTQQIKFCDSLKLS